MKNSTLILLTAMALNAAATAASNASQMSVTAQKNHPQLTGKQPTVARKMASFVRTKLLKTVSANAKKMQQTSQWKPLTAKKYSYLNSSWSLDGTYTFTYDNKGRIVKQIETEGDGKILTTFEYDPIVEDIPILQTESEWDETTGTWEPATTEGRAVIERNVDNLVTKITTYVTDDDGAEQNMDEVTTTYYDGKNQPKTISETFVDEEMGTVTTTMDNIKWKKTDGQIIYGFNNVEYFTMGANLMESADFSMSLMGFSATGKVNVTYDDNNGYSINVTYKMPGEQTMDMTAKRVYTDENGSFDYYMTNESQGVTEYLKEVHTYNDKGDVESIMQFYGPDENNTQMTYGQKSIFKYDGPHGEKTEEVMSEYNTYVGDYAPSQKAEWSDFFDVATSISYPSIVTSGNSIVYDLNGRLIRGSTENLAKGIYIVKKDGKTIKIVKK